MYLPSQYPISGTYQIPNIRSVSNIQHPISATYPIFNIQHTISGTRSFGASVPKLPIWLLDCENLSLLHVYINDEIFLTVSFWGCLLKCVKWFGKWGRNQMEQKGGKRGLERSTDPPYLLPSDTDHIQWQKLTGNNGHPKTATDSDHKMEGQEERSGKINQSPLFCLQKVTIDSNRQWQTNTGSNRQWPQNGGSEREVWQDQRISIIFCFQTKWLKKLGNASYCHDYLENRVLHRVELFTKKLWKDKTKLLSNLCQNAIFTQAIWVRNWDAEK